MNLCIFWFTPNPPSPHHTPHPGQRHYTFPSYRYLLYDRLFIISIIMFLKSIGKWGWDLTSKTLSVFHNTSTRYPLTTTKDSFLFQRLNLTNIYSGPIIKCFQEGRLSLASNPWPSRLDEGRPTPQKRFGSQSFVFIRLSNSPTFFRSTSYIPKHF